MVSSKRDFIQRAVDILLEGPIFIQFHDTARSVPPG